MSKSAAARANKILRYKLLEWLAKKAQVDWRPYTKQLQYLERYRYIRKSTDTYVLTNRGKYILNESKIWQLSIPTPMRWDGKWRLVMFDIPKDLHKRRDAFRTRLKEMGLVLYQHSIWVYPYPLETQVAQVRDFYKLYGCISFGIAEKLTDDENLCKHFGLS